MSEKSPKQPFIVGSARSLSSVQKASAADARALQAFIQKTNAAAKEQVIGSAATMSNMYLLRRPSGITDLDVALRGGLPASTLCVFTGPEGGGKTTLMYMYMAQQQRIYRDASCIGLVVGEQLPDYLHMRRLGVQVAVPPEVIDMLHEARVRSGRPGVTKEERLELSKQVGQFVLVNANTAETTFDIASELIDQGIFHLVGIDSFSMLETKSDQEAADESFEKNGRQASGASLVTKFTKHIQPMLRRTSCKTTVIGVCQVRANRSKSEAASHIQKYLPDFAMAAPWSLRHQISIGLLITSGGKTAEGSKEDRRQVGKTVKITTFKGKFGVSEGIVSEYDLRFDAPYDTINDLAVAAIAEGILEQRGDKYNIRLDDGSYAYEKGMTLKEIKDSMRGDVEMEYWLRSRVLAKRGVECIFW